MRAHPEPIGHYAPALRSQVVHAATATPTVLFAVPEADRSIYAGDLVTRFFAHTAADALRMLAAHAPRVVVLDWDHPALQRTELCAALHATPGTSSLVTTDDVANVPVILKAGCQGVLLKPFAPNLLAARLGRLLRETAFTSGRSLVRPGWQTGTNRVWPDLSCPQCGTRGATSFDFSSYRRVWYACLACDATWLGKRHE
jgi:CheY-like chemotaxis protein